MKYRMITLILALSAMAWAQTTRQTTPQQTAPTSAKAGCACCDKPDGKGTHSCCAHHDMSAKDANEAMSCCGKDAKSCCSGKDGVSCKRADNDKTTASCVECMKHHEKDCCAGAKKSDDTTPMSCCKEHCAAHAPAATSN